MWLEERLSDTSLTSHIDTGKRKLSLLQCSNRSEAWGGENTPCFYTFCTLNHSTFLLGRWLDVFSAQWLLIGVKKNTLGSLDTRKSVKCGFRIPFVLLFKRKDLIVNAGCASSQTSGDLLSIHMSLIRQNCQKKVMWCHSYSDLDSPIFHSIWKSVTSGSEENICYFTCILQMMNHAFRLPQMFFSRQFITVLLIKLCKHCLLVSPMF